MARNTTKHTQSTLGEHHRCGYEKFARLSQEDRVQELVRIGILTVGKKLAPRYGGKEPKK